MPIRCCWAPDNQMTEESTPLNRRQFLKTTSAVALAGTVASSAGLPTLMAGEPPGRPLRVSLVSAATYGYMGAPRIRGSNHGTAFATACNGYDAAKRPQFTGTFVAARKRIDGVQV